MVSTMRRSHGVLDAQRCRTEDRVHIHNKVIGCLDALLDIPGMRNLSMEGFDAEEIRQFMQMMLPGIDVHDSNVEAIQRQTLGHPVHVEQIALYIETLGDEAQTALALPSGLLSTNLSEIAATSMRHFIVSRVDGLQPPQQLTLKVCSVLGPSVSLDLLLRSYPVVLNAAHELRKQLLDDIEHLVEVNFLEENTGSPMTWDWQSTVARDVVYGVIPTDQRRLVHGQVASALESLLEDDQNLVPRSHVAYHWTKSCSSVECVEWHNTLRAIRTWKQAAGDMEALGAHLDAIRLMTKSLELSRALLLSESDRDGTEAGQGWLEIDTVDAAKQYEFVASAYFRLVLADQVRPCGLPSRWSTEHAHSCVRVRVGAAMLRTDGRHWIRMRIFGQTHNELHE